MHFSQQTAEETLIAMLADRVLQKLRTEWILNQRVDTFVVGNSVGRFDTWVEYIVPVAFSWRSGKFLLSRLLFQLLMNTYGFLVRVNRRRSFVVLLECVKIRLQCVYSECTLFNSAYWEWFDSLNSI